MLSGESYDELPDTYVIFICDFAWMPDQLYRYTYEMVCRENGSLLNQGQKTIFLSTKGRNDEGVSAALADFLKYVGQPDQPARDSFIAGLDRRIQRIKASRDWEARFMRLEIELRNKWRQGHQEGLQKGLQEGLQQGLQEGLQQGRSEGRREALKESVLNLLSNFGEIPEDIRLKIEGQEDETVLKEWLRAAAKADSMETFRINI